MSGAATASSPRVVLLIADSESLMLSAQSAIQGYGGGKYSIEWVQRMSDGLDRIREGGLDIILLDIGRRKALGLNVWFGSVLLRL